MKIRKVGVVGCGFMGAGIAQICAQSGYEVMITDTCEQILSKGIATIEYYLSRGVEKGRISRRDKDLTRSRIKGSIALKELDERDLVIEAIPEDMELKKRIFVKLDNTCPRHTVLCTNTSCLSVTELARATGRPDRVIGTHFLSPVPPSKLLEIVRADTTSEEILEMVKDFGRSLGKEILVARDTPGFIFNYLLLALTGAAVHLLENGVALTALMGSTSSEKFFKIEVPADQTKLEIAMSDGTGDADLYVRVGAKPTTKEWDYRPFVMGNRETVTIDSPKAGTYYIMIQASSITIRRLRFSKRILFQM